MRATTTIDTVAWSFCVSIGHICEPWKNGYMTCGAESGGPKNHVLDGGQECTNPIANKRGKSRQFWHTGEPCKNSWSYL